MVSKATKNQKKRREFHSDMEDKVIQDTLTNLEQNITRTEDVKRMIHKELKGHRDKESSATGQDSATKDENVGQLEEKVVEISKEIIDQNNRWNNIIINREARHCLYQPGNEQKSTRNIPSVKLDWDRHRKRHVRGHHKMCPAGEGLSGQI